MDASGPGEDGMPSDKGISIIEPLQSRSYKISVSSARYLIDIVASVLAVSVFLDTWRMAVMMDCCVDPPEGSSLVVELCCIG